MGEPRSDRLDAERPGGAAHLEFLTALFADPEVARWHWPDSLPGGGPRSAEQARRFHLENQAHWERYGYGWWLWRDRESGELVARVGLMRATVETAPEVEVGWSVPVAEQGRGYATEAAIASVGHAFSAARLERVVSFTWTENLASRRVMEKSGLRFERRFQHAGLPHALHAARAGEWSPPVPQAA